MVISSDNMKTSSSDITRRPYTRPVLTIHVTPTPKHWDVVPSGDTDLDINEEDGYVLSATGEGSPSFVPCDALSGIRSARRGRRIKSQILYHRRLSANLTSPTSNITCTTPSSGRYFYDLLPPTPSTPNTDFTHFYNNLRERERERDALQAAASPTRREAPEVLPVSPPATPATSSPSSSPHRQQRPILYVKTSSPVGTSAPPPTAALPSPSTPQFRPSARIPKRPVLPAWPVQYCPPAVAV